MRLALRQAVKARGRTSPNPLVGAVLVNFAKDLAAKGEILITKSRGDEELIY